MNTRNPPSEAVKVQHKPFPNLFALVIGIDTYKNANGKELCNLKYAVADANAVVEFLCHSLQVPSQNIHILRNEEATRENIIKTITSFSTREDIAKNSPIFIYYAGHGATSKYTALLPNDATHLQGKDFEVLVPSDVDLASRSVHDSGACVTGIADYQIRRLLNQVAKKKGNNIAMIMDCCHSASVDRRDSEPGSIREMINPAPLIDSNGLDQARDGGFVPSNAGLDNESHVLLAACGKDQGAREMNGHGVFTTAILHSLAVNPIQSLSYRSLLLSLRLENDTMQTPHCAGVFDNRRIFEIDVLSKSGHRLCGVFRDGQPVIPLGYIDGINEGVAVNVYKDSEGKEEPVGKTEVTGPIGSRSSFLKLSGFNVPNPFFATIIGFPSRFSCFCTDRELRSALAKESTEQSLDLTVNSNAEEECDVSIIKEPRKVIISRTAANRSLGFSSFNSGDNFRHEIEVGDTFSCSDLQSLCRLLLDAARFYHHLKRTPQGPPDNSKVTVELLYLNKDPEDYYVPLPRGNVIIKEGSATIEIISATELNKKSVSKPIGMRLRNNNNFDLHAYIFYFNPATLKIAKWHAPSHTSQEPDIELSQNSTLEVGFNSSNTGPFQFHIADGENIEVGYFKIFLARRSCPHLEDIVQDPLSNEEIRKLIILPASNPDMARWWRTEVIEVVQTRLGST
ncbi:hypothetical protein M422DRAFT_25663 [Sphaerobolus stellatus SS14]|nr:hypothetical protein M422DRAFT_25663 [Sphaerobolus stellatus SS14]